MHSIGVNQDISNDDFHLPNQSIYYIDEKNIKNVVRIFKYFYFFDKAMKKCSKNANISKIIITEYIEILPNTTFFSNCFKHIIQIPNIIYTFVA